MNPIDSKKLLQSYYAMLRADLTDPEIRTGIWEHAKELFPELATLLHEQLHDSQVSDNSQQKDRVIGAIFLFLALVNASTPEPILALGGPDRGKVTFPTFGNLPSLSD